MFLIALRRLDPRNCLAAGLGEAWRLSLRCGAPPGVPGFSAPVGVKLRRSRGRSGARPGSWGVATEWREPRPGPRDRSFPRQPLQTWRQGLRAGGSPWAPYYLEISVGPGTWRLECLRGEGCSWMPCWTGGC
ncbi:hypothetical protein NDU88_004638 [Pleurodeles waltl]|uniref:Uncharacterized protein n=1 Tax=Pleurodeles waltl TaxID=8319 RepID=A0AAV7VJA1_PLEWA|nr:hypothetical protein NDU88_004638 [Pleurodeles waltl]